MQEKRGKGGGLEAAHTNMRVETIRKTGKHRGRGRTGQQQQPCLTQFLAAQSTASPNWNAPSQECLDAPFQAPCAHARVNHLRMYTYQCGRCLCGRVCVCTCVAWPQWRVSTGLCASLFPPNPDPLSAEQRYSAEERERVNGASLTPAGGALRVVGHNDPGPACCRAALNHLLAQHRLVHHHNVQAAA